MAMLGCGLVNYRNENSTVGVEPIHGWGEEEKKERKGIQMIKNENNMCSERFARRPNRLSGQAETI